MATSKNLKVTLLVTAVFGALFFILPGKASAATKTWNNVAVQEVTVKTIEKDRFKFLDWKTILDKKTNTKYTTGRDEGDYYASGTGSMFEAGDYWYFPSDYKATGIGGKCQGLIYLHHEYYINPAGSDTNTAYIRLVQPQKKADGKCNVVYDGNAYIPKKDSDQSTMDESYYATISDKFSNSTLMYRFALLDWITPDKIRVYGSDRELKRVTDKALRDWISKETIEEGYEGAKSDWDFYSSSSCYNGSKDKTKAWLRIKRDSDDKSTGIFFHITNSWKTVQRNWFGDNVYNEGLSCLFGHDISNNTAYGPAALNYADKGLDYGGVILTNSQKGKTQEQLDEEAAIADTNAKKEAIAAILNKDTNKLKFCWQASFGRELVINSSYPRTGDYKSMGDFVNSYAGFFANETTPGDLRMIATMNCAEKAYGEELKAAIAKTYVTPDQESTETADTETGGGSACGGGSGGGALRWILCPVVSAINDGIKWVTDNILDNALKTEGLETSGTLYDAWSAIRNLANAFLVVVFLVVIFMNFFSDGSNAYTIKKTLPRVVAAAVLIQFSYFFCAILIDIGNVLGGGIGDLVMKAVGGAGGTGASTGANIASGMLLGVVGIGGGIVATVLGAWVLLLPLVIGLIISIITLFISLGVRIIAINLLVMLSPIALLAWVLPNTDKYSKMWMTNMLKLVMMYPFIILILSAAQVVVLVGAGNDGNTWAGVLTLFAPMIAFFMIPATFKMSGTMISGINNAIASKGKSFSKATAGALGKSMGDTIKKNAALKFADPKSGFIRKTAARAGMGLGTGFGFGSQSRMKRASATAAAFKEKKDLLHHDYEEQGISGDNAAMMAEIFDKNANGGKGAFRPDVDNATRAAVMQMISENGGVEEMSAMYESMRANNGGETHASKWKSADKELWTKGTATTRDRLAKALPYAVRPDADRALGKMDAEGITSLKSAAGKSTRNADGTIKTQTSKATGKQIGDSHIEKGLDEIAARAAATAGAVDPLGAKNPDGTPKKLTQSDIDDAKMQQQKVLASMVGIGQSTDRRGRIDGENVKAFARAAEAGLLGDAVMEVPGVGPMTAKEFADKFINTTTGQLEAVKEH